MGLLHNINNLLFRAVRFIGNLIPFKDDLYPIAPENAVCGINNSGGRWLKSDSTVNLIDQVGDESRLIEPDRCYSISTGSTGEIVLDTAISYSKYVYSEWRNGINTVIFANGTTKKTYTDGVLTGTVTSSAALSSILLADGNTYMIVVMDMSSYTAAQVDDFESSQACKFAVDNVDYGDYEYHSYLCAEKSGTISFDSGTALANNGTTQLDGTDWDLNSTTRYPEHIRNASNKEGWNKAARFNGNGYLSINNEFNMFGLTVEWSGKFDEYISSDSFIYVSSVFYIRRTSKTNLFIQVYDGVNVINLSGSGNYEIFNNYKFEVIDNNDTTATINFYINNVLSATKTDTLSNYTIPILRFFGDAYWGNGYLYNVKIYENNILTAHIPLNGSAIDLENNYTNNIANIDFNKIVIPNLPDGSTDIFGREPLYKGLVKYNAEWNAARDAIDFDPEHWTTYYSYGDNFIVDNSFNDATKWTGANWSIASGAATHSGTVDDVLSEVTPQNAVIGREYRIDFDADDGVFVHFGGNLYLNGETHIATTTDALQIYSQVDAVAIRMITVREATAHIDSPNRDGSSTQYDNSIGHLPHAIFDLANHVGNFQSRPEYWTADVIPFIDWSNTYLIPTTILDNLDTYLTDVAKALIYELEKNGTLIDIVVYGNKRTAEQQLKLIAKNYKPTYTSGLAT